MRKALEATAPWKPAGMLKSLGALGDVRANPRAMAPYDGSLAWSALLLLTIGLVMVYSASIASAEASPHTGYRAAYFFVRHTLSVGVGLFAAFIAFQIPMKAWQRLSPWLFVGGLLLLLLVLIPGIGRSVNGARRWLSLVVVNLQPSELMKLAVVLYLSLIHI